MNTKQIMVGVLLKDGEWAVLPVIVYDDGFNGSCWSTRVSWKHYGIEATFYKKTRNGRILYKQI